MKFSPLFKTDNTLKTNGLQKNWHFALGNRERSDRLKLSVRLSVRQPADEVGGKPQMCVSLLFILVVMFKTPYNAQKNHFLEMQTDKVSQTIPEQSYSLLDLIKRFSSGQLNPTDLMRSDMSSNEDENNLIPMDADLVDLEQIAKSKIANKIASLRKEVNTNKESEKPTAENEQKNEQKDVSN